MCAMKRRTLLAGMIAAPLLPAAAKAAGVLPEIGPVFADDKPCGTYRKIGNRVEFRATITYTRGGTTITGLPFVQR